MSIPQTSCFRNPSERAYPRAKAGDDDRLQLLQSMLADRQWRCASSVHAKLMQVLAASNGTQHADESAWIAFAEEIGRYLEHRRGCLLEALLTDPSAQEN